MRSRAYLGIEIGNSRIKIAEISKDKKLVNFAMEDLPENMVHENQIIAWDAMAELIHGMVRKNGLGSRYVALVIPDNAVYMRRTTLPLMTVQQLETNLPYEFHDFITDNKDEYLYDYSIVEILKDEDGNETEMDLLAVAASKVMMNNYSTMLRRAGLRLEMAAPQSLAMEKLFLRLNPEEAGSDFAVLDLGEKASRVNIYSNGVYEVTRSIETGCEQIAKAAADVLHCDPHIAKIYVKENKEDVLNAPSVSDLYGQIAIDVMRAINYYTFENRDNTLEKLYYCGGGSRIDALIEEIRSTIQLELEPLDSLAVSEIDDKIALMNGPTAIGICFNEEEN